MYFTNSSAPWSSSGQVLTATVNRPDQDTGFIVIVQGTFAGATLTIKGCRTPSLGGYASLGEIESAGLGLLAQPISLVDGQTVMFRGSMEGLASIQVSNPSMASGTMTVEIITGQFSFNPFQSAASVTPSLPLANFRNLIDGGDMTVNPCQRGTSQAADIAGTLTYGPDRWAFKGGAGSAINWSKLADTNVGGFSQSLKWQRKSANADTAAFNLVQVLETIDSVRCQGQQVTLSFWARTGANYSGGNLTVKLESGTGSDQSANNLIAGTWTGQTDVINKTQALSGSMTRYQFTGTVPANCTQLGVLFSWTPSGTAGADDSIVLNGMQLEVASSASPFEHRDAEIELALCQRYYFRITEQNGINVCMGAPLAINSQGYSIPLPTPMRVAPTVSVTAGGFKVVIDGGAAAAVTTFAAGSVHSQTFINLTTANTLTAAAHSVILQGSATTGLIEASADY